MAAEDTLHGEEEWSVSAEDQSIPQRRGSGDDAGSPSPHEFGSGGKQASLLSPTHAMAAVDLSGQNSDLFVDASSAAEDGAENLEAFESALGDADGDDDFGGFGDFGGGEGGDGGFGGAGDNDDDWGDFGTSTAFEPGPDVEPAAAHVPAMEQAPRPPSPPPPPTLPLAAETAALIGEGSRADMSTIRDHYSSALRAVFPGVDVDAGSSVADAANSAFGSNASLPSVHISDASPGSDSQESLRRGHENTLGGKQGWQLCVRALKDGRRIYEHPEECTEVFLAANHGPYARALSPFGLAEGSEKLLHKQLKRRYSFSGAQLQIRSLMALGFDQETFLKERDAKWKMQHARSLELGKCSVAELRHILELAKVQEANALQRNQEARRENELLQHEGRVRESLIPVLLDLIQRSHNPAQNTEASPALSPHGRLRLDARAPAGNAPGGGTMAMFKRGLGLGGSTSKSSAASRGKAMSDTDILVRAGAPDPLTIPGASQPPIRAIPWKQGVDTESLVQLKAVIDATLARQANMYDLLTDYVTTL